MANHEWQRRAQTPGTRLFVGGKGPPLPARDMCDEVNDIYLCSPMPDQTKSDHVSPRAWRVLAVSTLAFTVCFMVWMMFGIIGIPLQKQLGLNATEFGLLTAMPVLSGSLVRVPLGIWTDRYGGRIVMTIIMVLTVPAV